MIDKVNDYKQYTSNYINSLAKTAMMIVISRSALKDFPRNLPSESKSNFNDDLQFILERRRFTKQGFLTVEDYDTYTKDYDSFTKFSILLMLSNQYSVDALLKLRNTKNADTELAKMLVRDAFRQDFLKQNNVPDLDFTINDFNAKYGLPNVLTLNFVRENIKDFFTDSINYNHQLLSQVTIACLAQFESFLAKSIELFLATTTAFQIVTEKNEKGKRIKYLDSSTIQNNDKTKIQTPNLKWIKILKLYEFVSDKRINLLYNIKEEQSGFFKRFWVIRNLLVHNGGIIDRKFAKIFDLPQEKIGTALELDFDQVGRLFITIWRFSLRIYASLTNNR